MVVCITYPIALYLKLVLNGTNVNYLFDKSKAETLAAFILNNLIVIYMYN